MATAIAGLGALLMQTPAGILTDEIASRRALFAGASLLTGMSFAAIPQFSHSHLAVNIVLFLAGAAQSFFAPLLGALALALVGHQLLNKIAGRNQGWNHAGNIAAALAGMALVHFLGVSSVFYAVGASALLAAASVLLIRAPDLDEHLATGLLEEQTAAVFLETTPARKGSAGSVGVDLPFSSGERADHASHSAICETTGRLRCFNDGYGAYGADCDGAGCSVGRALW